MILLIIYLIGVIIAYTITRWANRKYHNCTKIHVKINFVIDIIHGKLF